jgi:hypothetical protein
MRSIGIWSQPAANGFGVFEPFSLEGRDGPGGAAILFL